MTTDKENKIGTDRTGNFRKALFDRAMASPRFAVYCSYYSDIDSLDDPGPLTRILGLEVDFFSDRETQVLNILENDSNTDIRGLYSRFKWRVLAFLSVQDVFDAPLADGRDLYIVKKEERIVRGKAVPARGKHHPAFRHRRERIVV